MKYVLIILAVLLTISLLISCGTRDDRNDIRAQYGEPSALRRTGVDPFWSETWFYGRQGLAFEFRRTSGCGSKRDVYLYATYPVLGSTLENLPKPHEKADSLKNFARPWMPVAPR